MALGESLRAICWDEDMPDKSTVMRWLLRDEHQAFRDQYAQAREELYEHWAEEIVEISDDGTNDWMERLDRNGESAGWQLNREHVQRSSLRVDSRKWLLSRLAAKKYGDRQHVEHGGKLTLEKLVEESGLAPK